MEVQKEGEEKPETGENAYEESSILSEIQSVKYEEVSEERGKPIELVEENINELMSEEVQASHEAPFEETLYLEDIEKPASNVEDHVDTGQLANSGDSFEEYGKPPRDAGLEDVSNTLASVEIKDSQGGEFNEETSVYQLKAEKSEQGQSAEQERSEYRIEGEYPAPEIGQEAKRGGSGESIKADDKVYDQINNNEIILEMDKIAPQIVIEEYGKVDHSVEMKQETYEGVLKAIRVFIDQKLLLGLTEGSGINDAVELLDIETQQAAECMAKEEIVLESQNQEKTTNKTNSQIVNDKTIPGPDLFEGILDSAEELQEEGCFTGDIVRPFQSECGPSEAVTLETPTDIIVHEQDSRLSSSDFQTEYKVEIEQDSHKTVKNVTMAKQDTEFEICDRGQNIEDKEFQDLTQEKVEDAHVKAKIGEEDLDEKLDDCVQAAEERTKRTEEFVTELEDAFNAVE
eukprot:g45563.t1